jgi:hypothetical protein
MLVLSLSPRLSFYCTNEQYSRGAGSLSRPPKVMEERTQLTEQLGLLRSQNQMLAKQVQQYEAIGTIDEITELGKTSEALRGCFENPRSCLRSYLCKNEPG